MTATIMKEDTAETSLALFPSGLQVPFASSFFRRRRRRR